MLIEVTPVNQDGKFTALVKSETNFEYAIRSGFPTEKSAIWWAYMISRKFTFNQKNLKEMDRCAWTQESQERKRAIRAEDVALPDWDGS